MAENSGDLSLGYMMGQSDGNNGGFGGCMWEGIWGIVLLAMVLGWGNGGFGGFGGGGASGALTRAELYDGFATQNIDSAVRGVQQGICDSTYALNNAITGGFAGVDRAVCDIGYQTQAGFNALGAQLAQCCCDNRAAVADLKYDLSTQFCGLGNAIQMQTRDIIDNQNANYRGIMDFLVTEKLSAKDAQIAQLQNQVSQANQNAVIRAAIDASTAEIIRRTGNDCPTPAYWVNPPTPVQAPCSWTNGGYNGGCGCGC